MAQYLAISVLATAGLLGASCTTIERAAPIFLSDADIVWIMNAADTNDIERGRLAEAQGTDPRVQAFGRAMIADHSAMLKENATLSSRFDIEPAAPALGVQLMETHEAAVQSLVGKSGVEFDRAYIAHEIEVHERMITLVGKAARTASHVALKELLHQAVPRLQGHLEEARSIKQVLISQTN